MENIGLSDVTINALHARNVKALFPIQKHVFDPAMAGRDLVARAKTGSGKTLAFSLPVIESLLKVGSILLLPLHPSRRLSVSLSQGCFQACNDYLQACHSAGIMADQNKIWRLHMPNLSPLSGRLCQGASVRASP